MSRFLTSENPPHSSSRHVNIGSVWINGARIAIGEPGVARYRQVWNYGNGIRIADEFLSMRPVRNHECRSCSRSVPRGDTRVFRSFLLRSHAILRCTSSRTSESSQIYKTVPVMGIWACLCVDLDLGGPDRGPASSKLNHHSPGTYRFLRHPSHWLRDWYEPQFSKGRSLQPQCVSSAPRELGAHLRLQAVR